MKTAFNLSLVFVAFISGCASFQVGSDVAAGRRALSAGNNEAALAYFQKAAQADPGYRHGTAYQQSIFSYVGRSEYAIGQYPQARQTLEKALNVNGQEDLARLYLGLARAQSGDRQGGLQEIESGMKGMRAWLDYVNQAHRYSFGQYWDPARAIRSSIDQNLSMIAARDVDWPQLIASAERIGKLMEEEGDRAQRDEARELDRNSDGDTEP